MSVCKVCGEKTEMPFHTCNRSRSFAPATGSGTHGEQCRCGVEHERDHSEFGLPLGYNRSCSKCGRMWLSPNSEVCSRSERSASAKGSGADPKIQR